MNLFNQKYELDPRPIEEGCQCPACRHYSRAYIRHLLKAKEMLGMRLCVLHNLYFYNNMMTEIRTALDEGNFASYKRAKLAGFEEYDKSKRESMKSLENIRKRLAHRLRIVYYDRCVERTGCILE